MKKWIKCLLIGIVSVVVLLTVIICIYLNYRPPVETVPAVYTRANILWTYDLSEESSHKTIEINLEEVTATIELSHIPVGGNQIQYSDEQKARDVFPGELYFGASEFRYDEESGIIYLMVLGRNPVSPYGGKRIFEFDVRKRKPLRDYWVEVN